MRTALIPLLALPDFPLSEHEPLAQGFLALGLRSFVDAARYVWQLPYGRNSNRADFRLVLPEGRGTCSTKHEPLFDAPWGDLFGVVSDELGINWMFNSSRVKKA
jgi:hypothetical protein